MAIERQDTVPNVVEPTKGQIVDEQEDALVNLLGGAQEEDFEIQEDGSAILSDGEMPPMEVGFDGNIADSLDDSELARISNLLVDGIEKDKSSRKDWEKTYTDGLKYLGMKFDEDLSLIHI